MGYPQISIVIPAWNNCNLLESNLQALYVAVENYPCECEIIIVDDGSTDGTPEFVLNHYPQIRLIMRKKNGGFSSAVNDGIHESQYDYVLLLNTDIVVQPDFIEPLAAEFVGNQNLFAASSMQFNKKENGGIGVVGKSSIHIENGHLIIDHVDSVSLNATSEKHPIANGGCSLFHKSKILAIGGFCTLFNPFYYEDVEISMQALLRGWINVFVPDSRVFHAHCATTKTRRILYSIVPVRNYIFLHLLLINSLSMWHAFISEMLKRFLLWPLKERRKYVLCTILALMYLLKIQQCRRKRLKGCCRHIDEVIDGYT